MHKAGPDRTYDHRDQSARLSGTGKNSVRGTGRPDRAADRRQQPGFGRMDTSRKQPALFSRRAGSRGARPAARPLPKACPGQVSAGLPICKWFFACLAAACLLVSAAGCGKDGGKQAEGHAAGRSGTAPETVSVNETAAAGSTDPFGSKSGSGSASVKESAGTDDPKNTGAKEDPGTGSRKETQAPELVESSGSKNSSGIVPAKTAGADSRDPSGSKSDPGTGSGKEGPSEPRTLRYIDAWKEWHTMEVDPSVRECSWAPAWFLPYTTEDASAESAAAAGSDKTGPADPEYPAADKDGKAASSAAAAASDADPEPEPGPRTFEEAGLEVLRGVDVSEHQGSIDWEAVAEAGYAFAFIRVGYRGYGEAGTLCEDSTAVSNLQAARAAGLQVGTYFFSQALSEEEAREEASLALDMIERSGISPDLPLMYDPELIRDDQGRANAITRDQVARNTDAFRTEVESRSPWKADIYSNLPWEDHYFDSDTLNLYDIWYADYEPAPQTPYHFTWWQYTNEGTVPGIEGPVDLNLWIRSAADE